MKRETREQRFWARADKSGGPNACWLWYPLSTGRLRRGLHHRRSYEFTHGSIPEGAFILHTCDVWQCCNPMHLYAGTNSDNARDHEHAGRMEVHGSAFGMKRNISSLGVPEFFDERRREALCRALGCTAAELLGEVGK